MPHDPAFEKVRRKMVRLLGVSIAVLFVGLIAVLSAVVYRTSDAKDDARAGGTLPPLAIGAGARITSSALDGDQALLTVERTDGGQDLLLLDLRSGTVAARYPVQATPVAAPAPIGN
ncbi:fimbrial protein [Aureimonas flava]|uniref:Fimbrial protein n=1 Tax=Aureimonas flava TaxID=2320271 RepID=A0A3A1WPZ6_9HYPH|nr:fimbrial protein [Aureimonas flava]